MAGNGKRGGGDRVLESRHLVSLFLGVVLLCGVFFTLGYVMGHNQYGGPVHAADSVDNGAPPVRPSVKPKDIEAPRGVAANPANNEWDFYAKKNNDDRMDPVAKPSVNAEAPSASVATRATNSVPAAPGSNAKTVQAAARFQAPRMVKGSVVLQIAALTHESDALAMADALQQKHFPSFVVTPSTDNFYRVQVGPYQDEKAAESAKSALDHAGFIAIIKR
ncbi:MAG TPA: SPOR domain-containing protein [Candidatus Acidoferrales bacterium]|jgi:DedD protein|nr:SPOR domain-containing protein [Candidatus Acidoferrales bacterium]